jgi:hypothetical protein
MPIASPSHQSAQADPYGVAAAEPAIRKVVTPLVAATAVATKPARIASARTSRARSSAGRKLTRLRRYHPASASSVFPAEIAVATPIETPLVALLTSAPTAIAGHRRGPRRTSALMAIPAGGQTGVITPLATERCRPNLAAPM